VSAGERIWRWAKRRPTHAGLALLTLLSVVGGFIGVSTQWQRAEQQRARAESQGRAARLNLYAADMGLAQQAIREGNLGLGAPVARCASPRRRSGGFASLRMASQSVSAQGEYAAAWTAHADAVRWLTFSRDGRWLATASADQTVKLWEADSWKLAVTLTNHTASVNCIAFSRDDRTFVTAGDDGVRFWQTAGWALVHEARGHARHVAFSPTEPDPGGLGGRQSHEILRSRDPVELRNAHAPAAVS
jgi:WD40 repeat protein